MSTLISVVIPVFNSEKTLEEIYKRIKNTLLKLSYDDFEIILVDDGSIDGSFQKMLQLNNMDSRVKIIQLCRNFGQQNAIMCGFHYAKGDYIITLDDDLQHPPEEISKLLAKLEEGYDVVFGIPYEKKHSFYRNIGTKLISQLFNRICKKPKSLYVSSFRIAKRNIVEKIKENKTSFVYIAPMIFQVTINGANVLINHEQRKYGKSNYSFYRLAKLFIKLVIYYTRIAKFIPASRKPQFQIKYIKI